ncbi:MAG: sulfatase [Bacteroidota bacterium]|nr:sulfatase [Bacteroidota bacterium]
MKRFALLLLVVLTSCAPEPPPNVVLVIIDDLGWKDLGVTGSEAYQTPAIDRLAQDGTRFTRFYSDSPVCSPTRAALMTGKHPARLNITNWIGGQQKGQLLQADYEWQLPLEETTIAEHFKSAGYATGFIGKWHLGSEGFFPQDQGFDVNVAGHAAGHPASFFWPYAREGGSPWDVPDLEDGKEGEYLTDRLTDEAISFIEDHPDDPFLLVLSHYAVHTPIQGKPDLVTAEQTRLDALAPCQVEPFDDDPEWSTTRTCQNRADYAAMMVSTDKSISWIRTALEETGVADRTIVAFVSDNGGLSTLMRGRTSGPTSNRPLRAGKGYLYEGGIRIPFIVHDPRSSASSVRSDAASTVDVVPTLLDLAGLDVPDVDGRSLARPVQEARPLFFHFPHYHGSGNRPGGAIIDGRFKLIEWFETGEVELYDLEADPGEWTNLAQDQPTLAESLLVKMRSWRATVDAKMPTPNPDWTGN